MSFLKELFGAKANHPISLAAPVRGHLVPIQQVNDETFSSEVLGKGAAIQPTDGRICAPSDGTVTAAFETGHALALTTADGVEVMVHVGIDTVNLKGKYFTRHVNEGDTVHKGDLLIEVDLEGARAEGYDMIVPVVVLNSDQFASITVQSGRDITTGEEMLQLVRA